MRRRRFCPNLKLLLNTTCNNAEDGQRPHRLDHRLAAHQPDLAHDASPRIFIDCSGDSVLAPLTGAAVRVGREAAAEFDEDIEPADADNRTMGNTLLIQMRETDAPQPFIAPKWAYKFRSPSDLPNRRGQVTGRQLLVAGGGRAEQHHPRCRDAPR